MFISNKMKNSLLQRYKVLEIRFENTKRELANSYNLIIISHIS